MDTNASSSLQAPQQNAAANLLAALKAGLDASPGSGLFADLLAQTETAPARPAAAPRAEQAAAPLPSARDATAAPAATAQQNAAAASDRAAQRRDGERKEAVKKTDKAEASDQPVKDETAQPDNAEQTASPDDAPVTAAPASKTETKTAATDGESGDDDLSPEEAMLMELLAALCPLDDKAGIAATNGEKTTQTDAATDPAIQIEAEVMDLAQQTKTQTATTPLLTDETLVEGDKSRAAIAGALQVKADHRAAKAEATQPTDLTLAGAANDDATAPVAHATSADAQQTFGDALKKDGKSALHQTTASGTQTAQAESSTLQPAFAVPTANAAAPTVKATAVAPQDAAQIGQTAAAGKPSAPQAMVGEGLRISSGYDFASQLSALRASKGGTVGLPQAVEQVAVQLHKMAKEGADEITINLKPAELGKIEIKLEIKSDKTVSGTVVAENQATLNMLTKDASSLHRALQDAGLQADPGSLSFSLKGENQNQFANQNKGNAGSSFSFGAFEEADASLQAIPTLDETYLAPGRVNLRV